MRQMYSERPWMVTFAKNSKVEPLRGQSVPIKTDGEEVELQPRPGYRQRISAHTVASAIHSTYLIAGYREMKAIETVQFVRLEEHQQSPDRITGADRSIYTLWVEGTEARCQIIVKDDTRSMKAGHIIG